MNARAAGRADGLLARVAAGRLFRTGIPTILIVVGPLPTTGLPIPLPRLRQLLLVGFLCVTALGLLSELLHHSARGAEFEAVLMLFSLSEEGNVPTWYSSALLLACALALALVAHGASLVQARPSLQTWRWWALSAAFGFVSLDEVLGLHERANELFDFGGVLTFGWVILGGAAVVLIGVLCLPLLLALPSSIRRRFVLSAILYVGGALLMELPLGYWTARTGGGDLGYALIDFVEESMEILGATIFLGALLDYLAAQHGTLRLVKEPTRP
jgi:hypothetical protein